MNDTQALLAMLEPLRDPTPIGWWPLAPGWWVLIVFLGGLIGWICLRLLRRYQRGAPVREARQQLAVIRDSQEPVRERMTDLSALQRRLAISVVGRRECAQLTGRAWSDLLNGLSRGEQGPFDEELLTASYRAQISDVDLSDLLDATSTWIDNLAPLKAGQR